MNRILAIDYGRRRIGLAISDPLGLTARGITTISVENQLEAIQAVVKSALKWEAKELLVGLPLNMDGSKGFMANNVEAFVEKLIAETDLPVIFWDERLSTVSAHRILQEMGKKGHKRKKMIDQMAATLFLEAYLQFRLENPL